MNFKPNLSPMKKYTVLDYILFFRTNTPDTILFEDFNVEPTNIVSLSYEYVPDDEDPTNWISWDSDVLKTIMLNTILVLRSHLYSSR